MATSRETLKHVGIALVVIGMLDIGVMVYCITTDKNYSSSLNIFAVAAGIFLIRGSLVAARIITWFLAFMLIGALGALIVLVPMTVPLDLLLTQIRLGHTELVLPLAIAVVMTGALGWAYWRLRSPEVLEARREAGMSTAPPYVAMFAGLALVVAMTFLMSAVMSDANGQQAIALAREREGSQYKYHVTGIRWANDRYVATVTAYNDREIKSIEVRWAK